MSAHRSHRRARRVLAQLGSGGLLLAGVAVVATSATSPVANAANEAISTTTNVTAPAGNGFCVHPDGSATPGEDPTNCNTYASRQDVWLSNLPQALGEGEYFLAVNVPGAQSTPNDGAAGLLSTDSRARRAFRVTASGDVEAIDPAGHLVHDNKIQLAEFDASPNGVYALSVCALPSPDPDAPVNGNDCKHDNFKVAGTTTPVADPLTVVKTASGAFTRTYGWDITKVATPTELSGVSGSVTADYEVTVSHDGGSFSDVAVTGTITVDNPNDAAVVADLTDTFSDGSVTCQVTGGGEDVSFGAGATVLPYTCDLPDAAPAADLTNTVDVTWDVQVVGDAVLDAGSASDTTDAIAFTETTVDDCVGVDDTMEGDLGGVCVGDANPTVFPYSVDFDLEPGCRDYPNTATFTTDDSGTTGSASATVRVCQTPLETGGHTIGFWQNKNGQGLINPKGSPTNVECAVTDVLRAYAPFKDLADGSSCAKVAAWVTDVIKKAKGSNMVTMLKAQMLATVLSGHYFNPALAGLEVDLTHVGGKDVSASFGGASSMTVGEALAYAASQSNVGGTSWYGGNKSLQTGAKDLFDAINNSSGIYAP
ncbi:hypothetical protein [Nocardioides sp. J54]|uniref:hypothetical protein n=1 Tax=Nocardioides sp. J54 TaxID=935866 RepID=UPI00048F6EF3|nr:hypothetical protein [Nocardioides sp. J54]